jgi:predicted ABC-type transport system involved in lysophospholipase L1 biosynthesis ATPase subunit
VSRGTPVLRLTDGLRFRAGPSTWSLEPRRLHRGEWVAFVPAGEEPTVDPAGPLARALITLAEPLRGTVEILGREVYRMDYVERQLLRAQVGFVQGYGGLLSNRTLRDNLALPLSIHGGLSREEERRRIEDALYGFALESVAGLYPHEVDGATRWRTCVARSLVLEPVWVVLEGIGDWEMDRGRGVSWSRLREYRERGRSAAAICLSRQNPAFEAWFEQQRGAVVPYFPLTDEPEPRSF